MQLTYTGLKIQLLIFILTDSILLQIQVSLNYNLYNEFIIFQENVFQLELSVIEGCFSYKTKNREGNIKDPRVKNKI